MRICLVSQEYPPGTAHGGIASQTYLKAHGLASLGHEVHVISHSTDQHQHESLDGAVRVVRIPSLDEHLPIHTEPVRWLTYSTMVAATLSELHAQSPLDLIEFPEWGGEGYVHLLNQTPWNHIPTVVHLHGPMVMLAHTIGWPKIDSEFYRVGTAMEEASLRLADAVFSSSDCSADWCARHYGLDLDQIPIVHSGVDTQLFHPLDVTKEACPTLIFVGKIVPNKGVNLLLEASLRLAEDYPDLQVWMLGRGDAVLVERLQQQARTAGFPRMLVLPGFVERQELPARLSRAHVFVAPSQYEGGPGFVYLEAMACGLPVVACEGSGASEVVIPEQNGVLVPPDDVDALVETLGRLLSNPFERTTMGGRARDYVEREADSEVCLKRLVALYTAVVGRKRLSKQGLD